MPSCDGKTCGDDGCGGDCGTCAAGQSCSGDGQCIDDAPVCECGARVCGDDGCGNSCGVCPSGQECNADGGCFTPAAQAACGNGTCEAGETNATCPGDCLAEGGGASSDEGCSCESGPLRFDVGAALMFVLAFFLLRRRMRVSEVA